LRLVRNWAKVEASSAAIHKWETQQKKKASGKTGKKELDIFFYGHIFKAWQEQRRHRTLSMLWRNLGGGTS
jgi:hypothetical protein